MNALPAARGARTESWMPPQGVADDWDSSVLLSLPKARLGLRVFLCVATALFLLIIAAYIVRMGAGDWWPVPEPRLLWLNTGVLILSSFGLQWAKVAAGHGEMRGVRIGLLSGGAFAWIFLAGQLWVWQQLRASGYFLSTNPANSFFYLITAVHGLHLLGGLGAWGKTMLKLGGKTPTSQVRLSIELCATYWHFLLLVWLVFFGLMLLT